MHTCHIHNVRSYLCWEPFCIDGIEQCLILQYLKLCALVVIYRYAKRKISTCAYVSCGGLNVQNHAGKAIIWGFFKRPVYMSYIRSYDILSTHSHYFLTENIIWEISLYIGLQRQTENMTYTRAGQVFFPVYGEPCAYLSHRRPPYDIQHTYLGVRTNV
jgi:hypothetical protein